MRTLLIVTCFLLACQAVRAGDPKTGDAKTAAPAARATPTVDIKPPAGKAETSGTTAATAYTPKTKSVFSAPADAHNPFWPIGWIKMDNVAAGDDAAPMVPKASDFTVSTIMLNEPPMAVINGKDMAEGEISALSINGQSVVVQLLAVQDGRVILRWQNQNLIVPIHRDEVLSPADTQPPLAAGTR
jgi:hypothetical protein